jgi:hypothetical protein
MMPRDDAGRAFGDNEMKRVLPALAAFGIVSGALSVAPAFAEQSVLSQVIFGKAYNDGVTAIRLTSQSQYDQPLPLQLKHPMPSMIRKAQATVSGDPRLMQAIEARRIALKNVVEVVTALNGGHVIYYR